MPPKGRTNQGKANRKAAAAALPPLPDSPDYLRSHEPLIESGTGSFRGNQIINALRGAAGHLLRKESLSFDEQVESWPYLFWPPLPQWYILPLERGVGEQAMAHSMNTTDRLEQFAVSGLFSNTLRPDYGGNLFYTNIVIPLFHIYQPEGKDSVIVWSLLHYRKGGKCKQGDKTIERDENDISQTVSWHVLTKWHADMFEADVRKYVAGLSIDGVLENRAVFSPNHDFVVCHNNGEDDKDNVEYKKNGEADPVRYGQHSFLFCVLTIACIALSFAKDPLAQEGCPPRFGTDSIIVHEPRTEGSNDRDQSDVPLVDVAASLLLLGIRDVFEHSRVRLVKFSRDDNGNDVDTNLDVTKLNKDDTNRWAIAAAEMLHESNSHLRLAAKMTFGGPYIDKDAAQDKSDDGNDGQGATTSTGGGAENENDEEMPPETPTDESPENRTNPGGDEAANSFRADTTKGKHAVHRKEKPLGSKSTQEEYTLPIGILPSTATRGSVQQRYQDMSEEETVQPTRSQLEESMHEADLDPASGLVSRTKSRKRSRNSLFSEDSEEEEEPTAKKSKAFDNLKQGYVPESKEQRDDEYWEGFDDEVEAILKQDQENNVEERSTESSEGKSADEDEFADDNVSRGDVEDAEVESIEL